jgi:hypothetical protein
VLVWSRGVRWGAWGTFAVLAGVVYALPLGMVALASVAGQ